MRTAATEWRSIAGPERSSSIPTVRGQASRPEPCPHGRLIIGAGDDSHPDSGLPSPRRHASECRVMLAPTLRVPVALLALAVVVTLTAVGLAQERGQSAPPAGQAPAGRGRAGGPGYLKLFDSNMPFDAHDLAGIWSPNANGFGGGGRCRDCGDRGYSFEFPEFTPAGQGAF